MTAPEITPGHPLRWPSGRPRTRERKPALFRNGTLRMSFTAARKRLVTQVEAMTPVRKPYRVTDQVLSTNIRFTLAGTRDQNVSRRDPDDPGVAFYFALDGRAHVLACDRWDTVADNIAAIAAHIEALRGQERWGVADLRQAFAGHVALPAPSATPAFPADSWWKVLGVARGAPLDAITRAYRQLAREAHPDAGGDRAAWDRLNAAYETAKGERP